MIARELGILSGAGSPAHYKLIKLINLIEHNVLQTVAFLPRPPLLATQNPRRAQACSAEAKRRLLHNIPDHSAFIVSVEH